MAHYHLYLAAALGTSVTLMASAATQHLIECPPEIPQDSVSITNPPTGWTPFARTSLRLSYAEPMFGPPAAKGFLKPSRSTASGDVWEELEGMIEGGKWIACRYGERGEVILAKRIADNTLACTVVSKKDKQGVKRLEISCIW
ncbi:STY0301 family protein [Pseudoduganella aquatica]|uniref:Uncharacterized protein n=1 Tax=Pseudoduganella aquatica TaxID=2660641 RepID=A0A7X4KPM9_9BURK|nr:STY0301 family protein [Pseudoduganella aquatica]MYN10438.1 hypothetical protein [Pseudoduganella aquatica]